MLWKIPSLSHRSENGGKCYLFFPPSFITFSGPDWTESPIPDPSELYLCPPGVGALLGRFQVKDGHCKTSQLAVQFSSEGCTLSGCDIQLVGTGYRLSLIKKRFAAGQFHACEAFWWSRLNAHRDLQPLTTCAPLTCFRFALQGNIWQTISGPVFVKGTKRSNGLKLWRLQIHPVCVSGIIFSNR